jgi:prevent-host-death family protein
MKRAERMQEISISEFKATCLAVIDRVKRTGKPVLVTRRGEPMAQVVPPPRPRSWLGCMAGTVGRIGDVVAPVAGDEEWEALRK